MINFYWFNNFDERRFILVNELIFHSPYLLRKILSHIKIFMLQIIPMLDVTDIDVSDGIISRVLRVGHRRATIGEVLCDHTTKNTRELLVVGCCCC